MARAHWEGRGAEGGGQGAPAPPLASQLSKPLPPSAAAVHGKAPPGGQTVSGVQRLLLWVPPVQTLASAGAVLGHNTRSSRMSKHATD